LLVDDVWTSGATMKECARVLKKSGVKRIFGFTLARTV
ncbi:MAG: amidophosphoribosyltransferase, partial [Parcubacteria group bacterium CG23_combo_of_CG06-09_8_20_14_all_35_6]